MSPVWQLTGLFSTALLLLNIWQLQRRSYLKPYPFLSLYLLTQLLVTIAEWAVSADSFKRLYWTTEFGTQFLLTMVMISFIYKALEGTDGRWKVLAVVVLVVIASGSVTWMNVGSMAIRSNRFSSLLARNLSFGAALLNVFLWQSLLKNRRNDVQLLLLSLGAGLWTTGRAIGQSLRIIAASSSNPSAAPMGNAILVFSEMLCLLIWLWALARFQLARTPSVQPTTPV